MRGAIVIGSVLLCLAVAEVSASASVRSEPDCRSSALALRAGSYGVAAGQFRQTFTFTNVTRTPCRLGGWPSFELADARGRPIKTRTERVRQTGPNQAAWHWVRLAPRDAASFNVFGADYDALHDVPCPKTTAVSIALPHDTARVSIRVRMPKCGQFWVAPFVAGRADRAWWSAVVRY